MRLSLPCPWAGARASVEAREEGGACFDCCREVGERDRAFFSPRRQTLGPEGDRSPKDSRPGTLRLHPDPTEGEMKTKSTLIRKVQLAFGAAILVLLVAGAISYRGLVISGESDLRVRRTLEVLENLQDLRLAIEIVESSNRGFALTGKESYLESYHASILRAHQDEAAVRKLTADNPEKQRQLPTLERLVTQKIQFAEMVITESALNGCNVFGCSCI